MLLTGSAPAQMGKTANVDEQVGAGGPVWRLWAWPYLRYIHFSRLIGTHRRNGSRLPLHDGVPLEDRKLSRHGWLGRPLPKARNVKSETKIKQRIQIQGLQLSGP
jgi:hypothetical protein